MSDSANHTSPDRGDPAANPPTRGSRNSTGTPDKGTGPVRGHVGGGSKGKQKASGIRDVVEERVRLRTGSRAIDPPEGEGDSGQPAPITTKRKKDPPPDTMWVLCTVLIHQES